MLHPELSNRIHDRLVAHGNARSITEIDRLIQSHAETLYVRDGHLNMDNRQTESEVEDMVMVSYNEDPDYALGETMEGYREF